MSQFVLWIGNDTGEDLRVAEYNSDELALALSTAWKFYNSPNFRIRRCQVISGCHVLLDLDKSFL